MITWSIRISLILPALLSSGCSSNEMRPQMIHSPGGIERINAQYLPNTVRLHARVISGGLPEGDAAFAELQSWGVKTLISVDGARPDVVLASKYGMRYVHLPHGYDGIPPQRAKELAKAVRDLVGLVYVHCHHGQHRSPAAAAVACVGAGLIEPTDAASVLSLAGTSAHYRGLYQSAEAAQQFDAASLDDLQCDFPAIAKLPAMAEAMVAVDHAYHHLQALEKAGWKTPAEQPALLPDHEALLLREHFTELLRGNDVQGRSESFRQFARDAEAQAQALEAALQVPSIDTAVASQLLRTVSDNCQSCHQAFRDVPLRSKAFTTAVRPVYSAVASRGPR